MQSHQFESSYSPTDGFTIKLKQITDGGTYTCRYVSDPSYELHFHVQVVCELYECHGSATILNEVPAIIGVARNTIDQITTKSTSHLTTIATASKSMIKPNRIGVGRSSLTKKRHLSSYPSNASMQSLSSDLQPNQHLTLYDVDVTTTTEPIITTINPHGDSIEIRRYSNRRQMPTRPYQLEKSKRRGKS